jgi:hypothetical protein
MYAAAERCGGCSCSVLLLLQEEKGDELQVSLIKLRGPSLQVCPI